MKIHRLGAVVLALGAPVGFAAVASAAPVAEFSVTVDGKTYRTADDPGAPAKLDLPPLIAPVTVQFTSEAYDPNGGPVRLEWDLNCCEERPRTFESTEPQFTWTFRRPRDYFVNLDAYDQNGVWNTRQAGIEVLDPRAAPTVPRLSAPKRLRLPARVKLRARKPNIGLAVYSRKKLNDQQIEGRRKRLGKRRGPDSRGYYSWTYVVTWAPKGKLDFVVSTYWKNERNDVRTYTRRVVACDRDRGCKRPRYIASAR